MTVYVRICSAVVKVSADHAAAAQGGAREGADQRSGEPGGGGLEEPSVSKAP